MEELTHEYTTRTIQEYNFTCGFCGHEWYEDEDTYQPSWKIQCPVCCLEAITKEL